MAYVVVQHRVRDYDAWKPVFDEHRAIRQKHGAAGHRLYRTLDDPNSVIVVNDFATSEGARSFMTDPSLPAAMERGGVEMPANVHLCDEVESVRY